MELPDQTSLYEVHHYAFVNIHKITIEIKAYSFIDGTADKCVLASPVSSAGTHSKKEFSVTGEDVLSAVHKCVEKLNNIKDPNDLFL